MTIIPQNIKDEAINILQNVAENIFLNNLYDLTTTFFSPFSSILVNKKIKDIMIEIYTKAINQIDLMFAESDYRKNNFYKSTNCSRTIIKLFGELRFNRYYYVDKTKKNGFYFIDELFHFEEYKTYDECVRAILIDHSINTNINNTACKSNLLIHNFDDYLINNFNKLLPRQTIYNWINKWELPKVEYNLFDDDSKNLYVMVDEKWIHEQLRLATLSEEERGKRHFIMAKCFVTFTGATTKNNRTTLLNRHIFLTSSDKPWKNFVDEIYNIYNYENFENIYLLSDSGTWIISGSSELKLFKQNKITLNTCEFHVKQYINRMTRSEEKRKEIINAIYEKKDKKKFITLVDKIIEDANNKEKKVQYKNYILNHWEAILNMKDRIIKSSMESHISHCVASTFGSRPKGYSRKRIEKYLKLQEYKENGINIMDLYLKSYNKNNDNYVYNKMEVSYSQFEHNTSILPIKSSNNPISVILNNIAYNTLI